MDLLESIHIFAYWAVLMNECIYGHCLCEDTVLFLMLNAGMRAGVPPLYLMSHVFHDVHLFMYSSSYSAALEEHGTTSLNALVCAFSSSPALDLSLKYLWLGKNGEGWLHLNSWSLFQEVMIACIKNSRMLSLALRLEKRELLPEKFWAAENSNIDLGQIAIPNLWVSYASITLSAKHRKFREGK